MLQTDSYPAAAVSSVKNKLIKILNLVADGLICFCRPYRGMSINLRLIDNNLKTHYRSFKVNLKIVIFLISDSQLLRHQDPLPLL